jgi:hypothetical protein
MSMGMCVYMVVVVVLSSLFSGRLSGEDIERMVEEAKAMKEEDDIRVAKIEAKNQLESVVYQLSELARSIGKPSVRLHPRMDPAPFALALPPSTCCYVLSFGNN